MRFSDELRAEAEPVWRRILVHPFIDEMAEGILSMEKFRYYIVQDYGYLIEFIRCLALATAKAESLDQMGKASGFVKGCVTYETAMLEKLSSELGIPVDALKRVELAPTNHGYTRHILNVAYSGSFHENIAALLPCMWTYQLIGEQRLKQLKPDINRLYREWFEGYASTNYASLVRSYIDLTDEAGDTTGPLTRSRMKEHFMVSSRYELLFWEMAYRMERWQ